MAVLSGRVQKVLFSDPIQKFFIFVLEIFEKESKFDDAPEGAIKRIKGVTTCTVSGNFPMGVIESQRYKVEGVFTQSKAKDGNIRFTLKAQTFTNIREMDTTSILSYLQNMHGIGPKLAKQIVMMFGEKTMTALLHPEELSKVKGISEEKANKIAFIHRDSKNLLALSKALSSLGINDFKLVLKLNKVYGENAGDMIVNHPYQIYMDEITSFLNADKMAMERKNPFATDDVRRIQAAYIWALRDAATRGDCCIKAADLVASMHNMLERTKHSARKEILKVEAEGAYPILIDMINNKLVCFEAVGDTKWCYQPSLNFAEKESAKLIRGLISPANDALPDPDGWIDNLESELGMKYAPQQRDAMKAIGHTSLLVVTGGPGTGKTTTLNGIIKYRQAQKPDCKILCLAPTGRAAQRMTESTGFEAATIHRGLEVEVNDAGLMEFRKNEDNPLDYDSIFIDEFSMVDINLFAALLRAIKPGTKLVLIGDKNQLPSVGPGCVLKDLIGSGKIPVVELAVVYRQGATSLIALNAAAIKDGRVNELKFDNKEFIFIRREGADAVADTCIELFKRGLAKYEGNADKVQILSPIRKINQNNPNATCCDLINQKLREVANPQDGSKPEIKFGRTTFRVGDKVMQFANNYEKNVMNGDSGYIVEIDEDLGIFAVQFGDRRIEYEKDELDQIGPAYAITIHKSQGSEYPLVIMPLCESQGLQMLSKNLVYTGITRGKVTVIIVGEEKAFNYSIQNTDIEKRLTTLKERI